MGDEKFSSMRSERGRTRRRCGEARVGAWNGKWEAASIRETTNDIHRCSVDVDTGC